MWNHAKNSMKQLKQPTSLISHWFPVEMVHNGPKLCKINAIILLSLWTISTGNQCIAIGNQWSWLFELFFAWSHIVCDRYTSDFAYFTFPTHLQPLSPNFGTQMCHWSEKLSYDIDIDIVQRCPFYGRACAWRFSPHYLTRQRSYLHRGGLI